VAGDRFEEQRRARNITRERPTLVKGAGERDQPEARHPAVCRLHADDAAEAGVLADRAAGVGAEGRGVFTGRDRRRGATAGAARYASGSQGLRVTW